MSWHPHPEVWLLLSSLQLGYLYAVKVWGPRLVPAYEFPATRRQRLSFFLGVASLWVASDWPVHDVAEGSLYSVHMVQHLIFALVAPPLLLMGTPGWLARALLRPRWLLAAARRITRPLPALVIFNGVVVLTHWPALVNFIVRNHEFHFFSHLALFGAALIMWTPVTSPLLELPRLSYPGRMFYLFLQSIVPTVPASFLTFSSSPLYESYVTLPKLWGVSALADQQVAGLVMKIGGGFILWAVIAVLFFRWHALEEREGVDVLQWRDVEAELNKLKLEGPMPPAPETASAGSIDQAG